MLEAKPPRKKSKVRWGVIFKDLSQFVSLCSARLMVWGVLRRYRKERASRLKRIKLVPDATDKTLNNPSQKESGDPQC